jgi:hypothetical protein
MLFSLLVVRSMSIQREVSQAEQSERSARREKAKRAETVERDEAAEAGEAAGRDVRDEDNKLLMKVRRELLEVEVMKV